MSTPHRREADAQPMSAKPAKFAEADTSSDTLDQLLDAIYGDDRGAQLPGHFGNGIYKTPKRAHR